MASAAIFAEAKGILPRARSLVKVVNMERAVDEAAVALFHGAGPAGLGHLRITASCRKHALAAREDPRGVGGCKLRERFGRRAFERAPDVRIGDHAYNGEATDEAFQKGYVGPRQSV